MVRAQADNNNALRKVSIVEEEGELALSSSNRSSREKLVGLVGWDEEETEEQREISNKTIMLSSFRASAKVY